MSTGQTRLLLVEIGKLWPSKLCSYEYVFQKSPFSAGKQGRVFSLLLIRTFIRLGTEGQYSLTNGKMFCTDLISRPWPQDWTNECEHWMVCTDWIEWIWTDWIEWVCTDWIEEWIWLDWDEWIILVKWIWMKFGGLNWINKKNVKYI